LTRPRIVCIPSRDARLAVEARRLAERIPAHVSGGDALGWFESELRRDYPNVTVRQQNELARAIKDQVTWYVTVHEERFRIEMEVHVPLPPAPAFEIYVDRVTEWQRMVTLRPRKLEPGLVGSEYDAVYRFVGWDYVGTFRIVAADPPVSVSIEASGSGVSVAYTATFVPDAQGTRVHVKGNYVVPDHFLGRVADRLVVERAITRDVQRANEAYRQLCEAVSRSPG